MLSKILSLKARNFVVVAAILSSICLTGCASLKTKTYTDEEIERLEKEVRKLPKNSIIHVFLNDYLDALL